MHLRFRQVDSAMLQVEYYLSLPTQPRKSFGKSDSDLPSNLAPGAWLECQECDIEPYSTDGTLTNEHAIKKLHDFWRSSCERMRLVANPVLLLPHLLETAGFQNINHKIIKMPFGLWPKDDSLVRPNPLSLFPTWPIFPS